MNHTISYPDYLNLQLEERVGALSQLRDVFLNHIPKGFQELITENGIEYVVPHSIYTSGYHCNPKLPLPFINVVTQKNMITIHHLGFYASPDLLQWFIDEYKNEFTSKLDFGKACVKFKKMDQIPYKLIGKLLQKMTLEDWIDLYEKVLKK